MKAASVTDSTVLRRDQSSRCLLATEIDLNRAPKWALIKSEDELLIATSSSQILQTEFLIYLCGLQDVQCGMNWTASQPLLDLCAVYRTLFPSLLGTGFEILAFSPRTEGWAVGFLMVTARLWCCDSCSSSVEVGVIGELSGPDEEDPLVSLMFTSFN